MNLTRGCSWQFKIKVGENQISKGEREAEDNTDDDDESVGFDESEGASSSVAGKSTNILFNTWNNVTLTQNISKEKEK